MNITLSADKELIQHAREYAQAHQTTLNQMVRDYLAQVVGERTKEEAAAMFRRIAEEQPGRSPAGWRFDRNTIHRYD